MVDAASGSGTGVAFTVEGVQDASQREMVGRLLPLCEAVALLQRWVEARSAFGYGTVSHALAAAFRALLQVRCLLLHITHPYKSLSPIWW